MRHGPILPSATRFFALQLAVLLVGCGAHSANPSRDSDVAATPQDAQSDSGATRIDRDGGWTVFIGGSCLLNEECRDSPASRAEPDLRCIRENYCLGGICHSECTSVCTAVRADINPCPTPWLCTQLPASGGTSVCKIVPIVCETADTCPKYKPPMPDGGLSDWTCENGICRFPGFEYPTQ